MPLLPIGWLQSCAFRLTAAMMEFLLCSPSQGEVHESQPDTCGCRAGRAADRHLGQPDPQSGDPAAAEVRGARFRARRHGAFLALDRDDRRHGGARPRPRFPDRRAAAQGEPRVDHAPARHRRLEPALPAGRIGRACRRDRRGVALCARGPARHDRAEPRQRLRHRRHAGRAQSLRQSPGVRDGDVRDRARVRRSRRDRGDGRASTP